MHMCYYWALLVIMLRWCWIANCLFLLNVVVLFLLLYMFFFNMELYSAVLARTPLKKRFWISMGLFPGKIKVKKNKHGKSKLFKSFMLSSVSFDYCVTSSSSEALLWILAHRYNMHNRPVCGPSMHLVSWIASKPIRVKYLWLRCLVLSWWGSLKGCHYIERPWI